MHFSKLLAFVGLASAMPTALEVRQSNPTWTLKNFRRWCDDTQNNCTYEFIIVASTGQNWPCKFTDYVRPTEPSRSARFSSPSNLQCQPGTGLPIFVNIGYDAPGKFWVVVPVNTQIRRNAFFGYDANEMRDYNVVRPDKTSRALVWGVFDKRVAVAEAEAIADASAAAEAEAVAVAEPETSLVQRDHLGSWTVKKLVRKCEHNKCTYNFEIARNDGTTPTHCTTEIAGPNTQSWYAVPCKNQEHPQWNISWGYNHEFGYAVMTVVNTNQQRNAWFGFNNVNSVTNFPDVGPNPVAAIA